MLFGAALASALLNLAAEYRGPRWLVYVTKPLTTTLLLLAAAAVHVGDPPYQIAIVAGLACSLAGDVFLMLPRDHFVAGLASFLCAHVAYIVAFTRGAALGARPLLAIPYAVAAACVLALLWPRLGRLRAPVVVYVAALVMMAWQAAARAAIDDRRAAYAAALGAALFVVSDAMLAIARFRRPFCAAQAVVMSTYVAAQALIAYSVVATATSMAVP